MFQVEARADARANAASPASMMLALFRDLQDSPDARVAVRPNTVAGDGQHNRWGSFGYAASAAAAAAQEAQSQPPHLVADVRCWDAPSFTAPTTTTLQQPSLASVSGEAFAAGVAPVFSTTVHQRDASRKAYYTPPVPSATSRCVSSSAAQHNTRRFAFSPPAADISHRPNSSGADTSAVVFNLIGATPPTPPSSQPRLVPLPNSPVGISSTQPSFATASGQLSLASPLSLRPKSSDSAVSAFSVPERAWPCAPSASSPPSYTTNMTTPAFRSVATTSHPTAVFSDATAAMGLGPTHYTDSGSGSGSADARPPHTADGEMFHPGSNALNHAAPPLLLHATSSTPSPQFSSPLLETPLQTLPDLQADASSAVPSNPAIIFDNSVERPIEESQPECASSSSSLPVRHHPHKSPSSLLDAVDTVQSFIGDGQPTPLDHTHINTTHHTPASFWHPSYPSSSSPTQQHAHYTNQHPHQQQQHLRRSMVNAQEHHTSGGFYNTLASSSSSSPVRATLSSANMPSVAALNNSGPSNNNAYDPSPSSSQHNVVTSSPQSATNTMAQNAMYPMSAAAAQGTASAPTNTSPNFATNMNVSPHQTSMRDQSIASSNNYYNTHILQQQQQQQQGYSPQQSYSQLSQYPENVSPYSSQHSFHESSSYSSNVSAYHQAPNSAGSYHQGSLGHGRSDSMGSWTMGENTSSSEYGGRRTKSGNRKATDEPLLAPGEEAVPRPSPSYAGLIGEALLLAAPPHQLYVSEISESIKARYQYYRQNPSKLYNGVRHQTSMCKAFVKLPRPFGDQSGGARKWAIREGCQTWFYDSNYHPPASVQTAVKASKKSKNKQLAIGTGGGKFNKNNDDGMPFTGVGPSSGKAWDPVANPLPARLRPGPPKEVPLLPPPQPPTATAGPSHQIPRIPQTATAAGPAHHGLVPSQHNQPSSYAQPYPYPVPSSGYNSNWVYPPHPHHYAAAQEQNQGWRGAGGGGFALGESAFERNHRHNSPGSDEMMSPRSDQRGLDPRVSPGPDAAYNTVRPSSSPLSTPPSGSASSLSHEA